MCVYIYIHTYIHYMHAYNHTLHTLHAYIHCTHTCVYIYIYIYICLCASAGLLLLSLLCWEMLGACSNRRRGGPTMSKSWCAQHMSPSLDNSSTTDPQVLNLTTVSSIPFFAADVSREATHLWDKITVHDRVLSTLSWPQFFDGSRFREVKSKQKQQAYIRQTM